MDKYIGIIAAEEKEVEEIKKLMENIEQKQIYNLTVYIGVIGDKRYALVKSGVGKVNAARTTQILVDKFDLNHIINYGSAGALNDNLNIGDIVIGEEVVQHDFDVTAFGREKGYIPETGKFFKSNYELIEKCKRIELNNVKIISGVISSGDVFCNDINMKKSIRKEFNAECVEMEGAAVAQVCYLNEIPFIIIRSISDIPNGKNEMDFEKCLEIASKNCAELVRQM